MNTDIDNLKSFVEKIRSITLFQRLFKWKQIRNSLVDVAAASSKLITGFQMIQDNKNQLNSQVSNCNKDTNLNRTKNKVGRSRKETRCSCC